MGPTQTYYPIQPIACLLVVPPGGFSFSPPQLTTHAFSQQSASTTSSNSYKQPAVEIDPDYYHNAREKSEMVEKYGSSCFISVRLLKDGTSEWRHMHGEYSTSLIYTTKIEKLWRRLIECERQCRLVETIIAEQGGQLSPAIIERNFRIHCRIMALIGKKCQRYNDLQNHPSIKFFYALKRGANPKVLLEQILRSHPISIPPSLQNRKRNWWSLNSSVPATLVHEQLERHPIQVYKPNDIEHAYLANEFAIMQLPDGRIRVFHCNHGRRPNKKPENLGRQKRHVENCISQIERRVLNPSLKAILVEQDRELLADIREKIAKYSETEEDSIRRRMSIETLTGNLE